MRLARLLPRCDTPPNAGCPSSPASSSPSNFRQITTHLYPTPPIPHTNHSHGRLVRCPPSQGRRLLRRLLPPSRSRYDSSSPTKSPPPQFTTPANKHLLPQYCEFGGTTKKCSEWLSEAHPDLYTQLYSSEALSQNLSSLSVDAQKRAEKDAQKKAAKAEAAEARESEKRASSKIIIKRVERNKRKHVTEISGLEHFNIDLKKAAKEFSKKFATSASVTKTASGGEEITVQGDVSDEVLEWVTEKYDVPEDNVEQIEDKKKEKKAAPPMVAPQPT